MTSFHDPRPVEDPFPVRTPLDGTIEHPAWREACADLRAGLTEGRKRFLVTGDAGTGKRQLAEWITREAGPDITALPAGTTSARTLGPDAITVHLRRLSTAETEEFLTSRLRAAHCAPDLLTPRAAARIARLAGGSVGHATALARRAIEQATLLHVVRIQPEHVVPVGQPRRRGGRAGRTVRGAAAAAAGFAALAAVFAAGWFIRGPARPDLSTNPPGPTVVADNASTPAVAPRTPAPLSTPPDARLHAFPATPVAPDHASPPDASRGDDAAPPTTGEISPGVAAPVVAAPGVAAPVPARPAVAPPPPASAPPATAAPAPVPPAPVPPAPAATALAPDKAHAPAPAPSSTPDRAAGVASPAVPRRDAEAAPRTYAFLSPSAPEAAPGATTEPPSRPAAPTASALPSSPPAANAPAPPPPAPDATVFGQPTGTHLSGSPPFALPAPPTTATRPTTNADDDQQRSAVAAPVSSEPLPAPAGSATTRPAQTAATASPPASTPTSPTGPVAPNSPRPVAVAPAPAPSPSPSPADSGAASSAPSNPSTANAPAQPVSPPAPARAAPVRVAAAEPPRLPIATVAPPIAPEPQTGVPLQIALRFRRGDRAAEAHAIGIADQLRNDGLAVTTPVPVPRSHGASIGYVFDEDAAAASRLGAALPDGLARLRPERLRSGTVKDARPGFIQITVTD